MTPRRSLDQLTVQEPCHQAWDAMQARGSGRRFCDACDKAVHDLSAMSRDEAERLVNGGQSVCVRMTFAADGRLLTRDSAPPSITHKPHRWLNRAAALLTVVGLGSLFNVGCDRRPTATLGSPVAHTDIEEEVMPQTMGRIAVPAVPTMGMIAPRPAPTTAPAPQPLMGKPAPVMGEVTSIMGDVGPTTQPTTQPVICHTSPYDSSGDCLLLPIDD